jgi:hypothetical protein
MGFVLRRVMKKFKPHRLSNIFFLIFISACLQPLNEEPSKFQEGVTLIAKCSDSDNVSLKDFLGYGKVTFEPKDLCPENSLKDFEIAFKNAHVQVGFLRTDKVKIKYNWRFSKDHAVFYDIPRRQKDIIKKITINSLKPHEPIPEDNEEL